MSILRTINIFRRPDSPPPSYETESVSKIDDMPEEAPDLYYDDRSLGNSIHALQDIRLSLRQLAVAANEHKHILVATANSATNLGNVLKDVVTEPQFPNNDPGDFDDLTVSDTRNTENERPCLHFSSYLPLEAREAQKALGRGLVHHSDATIKLSVALSTPINDLLRSFEDRYSRKIIPLRKRYIDQKGQYLKYNRNADMSETDEKRSYYHALADAAKPVWQRTSTELRTEAEVMTELTAKNMAKWSRSLAMQHERALAIATANFADAFHRAKSLPSLSRTPE